jgi:hypothetical protein
LEKYYAIQRKEMLDLLKVTEVCNQKIKPFESSLMRVNQDFEYSDAQINLFIIIVYN